MADLRPPLLVLTLALAGLSGCGSDSQLTGSSACDGVLESGETSVDDGFDLDGDGYFDAENEECLETYGPEQLDCDDSDANTNPGAQEEACNGLDDDCSEDTSDEPDADGDGATPCDGDCDDNSAAVGPGLSEAACDGLDNDCVAATLDGEDGDGDGYTECEDCDDENDAVNPASVEADCNGLDDDCNELTPDGDDFDNDTWVHCFDCDDANPLRYPGATEICGDGIDQNCDTLDPACPPPTWDGYWTSNAVSYYCATDQVSIDFTGLTVIDQNPVIDFAFGGPGAQPGTVSGTLTAGDTFNASVSVAGTCTEDYAFVGSFTDANTLTGTLTATFTDTTGLGVFCYDCTTQSFSVTATR